MDATSTLNRIVGSDNSRFDLAQMLDSLVRDIQMGLHQVGRRQRQPLAQADVLEEI